MNQALQKWLDFEWGRPLIVLLLAFLAFQSACFLEAERSLVHYIFLIPFLYISSQVSIAGKKVPRLILAMVLLIGIVTFGFSRTERGTSQSVAYLARLADDPLGARTRVLRELIAGWYSRDGQQGVGARIVDFHRALDGEADALSLLSDNDPSVRSKPSTAIWGESRWVRMTFGPYQTIPVSEYRSSAALDGREPLLIDDIPGVGFSEIPEQGTAHFTGAVLSARQADRFDLREVYYRDAGGLVEGWSSFSHRAYPFFQLGNLHLKNGLQGGGLAYGEVECAIEAYQKSLEFLSHDGDPRLRSAVLNNLSIVHFILWGNDLRKRDRRAVKKFLKQAKREQLSRGRKPFTARVARYNLRLLAPIVGSTKLQRRMKNIHKRLERKKKNR